MAGSASNGSYKWVDWSSHSGNPPNMILGGKDSDGSEIYVGRAQFKGDMLPAKVIPKKSSAYVAYDGKEVPVNNCQVLCEPEGKKVKWVKCSNGSLPTNAVIGGKTSMGEDLYIGRAPYNGSLIVGKVYPSHRCLYIPYDGKEVCITDYEVLVFE